MVKRTPCEDTFGMLDSKRNNELPRYSPTLSHSRRINDEVTAFHDVHKEMRDDPHILINKTANSATHTTPINLDNTRLVNANKQDLILKR